MTNSELTRRNLLGLLAGTSTTSATWAATGQAGAQLIARNVPYQACSGSACYPQTAAETAAKVHPTNLSAPPGNVLRYSGSAEPGTGDMSAAFQAALDQCAYGGASMYVPAGSYHITASIVSVHAAAFHIYGDGMGRTIITKTGDSDAFRINNAGSAYNQITLHDFTITTTAAMTTGAAFNLACPSLIPSVTAYNIAIITGGSSGFSAGFNLVNCGECEFTRVFIYATTFTAGTGWTISAAQSECVYKFVGCSVYGRAYGALISSTSVPGIEGLQFYACDFVVQTGVSYSNSRIAAYGPCQIAWEGGHINASVHNFKCQGMYQILIQGALFYNSGGAEFMSFDNCQDLSIAANTFEVLGSEAPNAITIDSSTQENGGIISSNIFRLGATGDCIQLLNAAKSPNLLVHGNQRIGGSAMVTAKGTIAGSVVIVANIPLDALDVYDDSLSVPTSTMTLAGIRSEYVLLGAPHSSTTITKLTSRRFGDKVTLSCSSNLVTLQHSSGNPDGFRLQGAANYTFPSTGGRLTLHQRDGGCWTEVSRAG